MGSKGPCFICEKETVEYIAGKTHVKPIGDYRIQLCDSCKSSMGDNREKLREEVLRQVAEAQELRG